MEDITNTAKEVLGSVTDFIKENPVVSTIGIAGGVAGVALGTSAIVGTVKSRKTKRRKGRTVRKKHRRIKHTKRGWAQDRRRRSKQKWEVAYQRRKHHRKKRHSGHKRGVHYARKTGQPYIILNNGRAKFIKGKRRKH